MRLIYIAGFFAIAATFATQEIARQVDATPPKSTSASKQAAANQAAAPASNSPAVNGVARVAKFDAEPGRDVQQQFTQPARRALPEPSQSNLGGGCRSGQPYVLQADNRGHFETLVEINGLQAPMLIDTGASIVTLPYEQAIRLGLNLNTGRQSRSQTANGSATGIITRAPTMRIGTICLYDVEVHVAGPGALHIGLLGMNVIRQLRRFELSQNRLVLEQ